MQGIISDEYHNEEIRKPYSDIRTIEQRVEINHVTKGASSLYREFVWHGESSEILVKEVSQRSTSKNEKWSVSPKKTYQYFYEVLLMDN